MQLLAALRRGPSQHQPSHQPWPDERDLLSDIAADRVAEEVKRFETERVDEGQRVMSHRRERPRGGPARAADARVVEQDHLAPARDCVDKRRIPVVEVAPKVHEKQRRRRAPLGIAEPAVGIGDPVSGLNALIRSRQLRQLSSGRGRHVEAFHSR